MGKKGRSSQKNGKRNGKKSSQFDDALLSDDMHDEIDAFHKQRDIIPLDINDDDGDSGEDEELPVFDLKGSDDDEDEFDDDDDDDDDKDIDDDASDDVNDDMTRKIIRQRKYLRAKFGGGEDEIDDDDDNEDEDDDKPILVGKHFRHGADNRHFELQSSDDEALKEEEELAKQLQRERTKFYTEEDYDLVGLKESSFKGKESIEPWMLEDTDKTYKVEDLNALLKDEQMDTLNRSYPELIFWLSELNGSHDQLECKINPWLSKVKAGKAATEGVSYFELKKVLLLLYCQAITFYLLLKSEGKPVHGHPVMGRLEEIKKLLDQVLLSSNAKLPVKLDDSVEENHGLKMVLNSGDINASMDDSFVENHELPLSSDACLKETVSHEVVEMPKVNSSKDNVNEERKQKHEHKKDHIGLLSSEMLKIRASLEQKLKQKAFYSSTAPKTSSAKKRSRPLNGLDTCDDFDDDNVNAGRIVTLVNGLGSGRNAQLANLNQKKPRVISGDDDLPKRDDIGERRRKFELRAISSAGLKSEDVDEEIGDPGFSDQEDGSSDDSENDLYEKIKQQRDERLAAKAKIYSRNEVPNLPEPDTLDENGRRPISYEMEKNRGLTRYRKKLTKNPRKKYKEKHKKALKRRSGQVRSVKSRRVPMVESSLELTHMSVEVSGSRVDIFVAVTLASSFSPVPLII